MTLTSGFQTPKERTILWGIALSILLHGVFFIPGIKDIFEELDFELPNEIPVVPMEFTLVSPPENPTPSNNISKYLSTVSSAASDVVDTENKTDLPHGEGEIPIPDTPSRRDGAEGGGQSEVPPLPEETTDLGDILKKAKFIEQQSPQREQSMPEQVPDFRNKGSAMASLERIFSLLDRLIEMGRTSFAHPIRAASNIAKTRSPQTPRRFKPLRVIRQLLK